MSGPKVVRIVTREELIATCEAHLARLDGTIRQWTKAGQRNDVLADADIEVVSARREQIAQLLKAEDFMAVQKQAPLEIDFLQRDTQFRLDLAAKKAFEARQRGRRNAEAGRVLLAALAKAGRDIPSDVRRVLENAGGESTPIDAAFSLAFTTLNPDPSAELSETQIRLAAYHGGGEVRHMFPEWLAKQADANTSTFRKLDQALAELGTLGNAKDATEFGRRSEALSGQPIDGRAALLIDSLVMDVQSALKDARAANALFDALSLLQAELGLYSNEQALAFIAEIKATSLSRDAVEAERLTAEVIEWLKTRKQADNAALRREAMLKGLSELGYAINEGLETLWAQDGKVVLRRAASPDYGVEIAGGQADKVQVRVVSFGTPGEARDTSRDRDMETIWCGDFGRLQASFAAKGTGLVIEKALAVGEAPVKVISGDVSRISSESARPVLRTL